MEAKRAAGGRHTSDDDLCGRPTQPVPMRIPREAYRSTRPPADEYEPHSARAQSRSTPASIHEAVTIPPPAMGASDASVEPAVQADALAEIDDAWD